MPNETIPQVDLAVIASQLQQVFGSQSIEGPIVGRTLMRDEVARLLGCSLLQAEELVDTMVGRGILVLDRSVGEAGAWHIQCPPEG